MFNASNMPIWIDGSCEDVVTALDYFTGITFESAEQIWSWLDSQDLNIETFPPISQQYPIYEVAISKPYNRYSVLPAVNNGFWYGTGYTEFSAFVRALVNMYCNPISDNSNT